MLTIKKGARYRGQINGAEWTILEYNEKEHTVIIKDAKTGQRYTYGAESYKRIQADMIVTEN